MNDLLKQLLAGLKGTSGGTKAIVALVGASLLAILGLAAYVADRPHFELAFSGLTDHEVAAVNKALSEAAVPFTVSQPPAPFTVYVDQDERTAAYMAVYGAGALDKPLKGILADDGVASVFHSAEERAQGVRKREWEEMEKLLEGLDFVASASVRSAPGSSALLGGKEEPATASVTLHVKNDARLTSAQATTVANLVSRGLGIAKGQLVISDQSGLSLYDGEAQGEDQHHVRDALEHQVEYDRRMAGAANAVLEEILGASKARVSVSSEWDYSQSTLRTETAQKGPVLEETKTTSEKPVGAGSGGDVVGVSSNTLDPDAPGSTPTDLASPATAQLEKTSEERKQYAPSITREERVRFAPELKRLSVALFLDQSLPAPQHAGLEAAVKASVGFSEERDEFSSVVLPFVTPPAPEPVQPAGEAAPAEPNPLLETLLRRGVEIVSALVFLVLLLKSLKGARRTKSAAAERTESGPEVDPELLARAQVEELLHSDPSRVGEILARWAREEPAGTRS